MKKIITILFIAELFSFAACVSSENPNKKDMDRHRLDSIRVADSIAKVENIAKISQERLTKKTEFRDGRDNKIYKIITIGTQTWMAENLAYDAKSGCWAYNDDPGNVSTYGYLYDWETAKTVCPSGWHLPSDAESIILFDYLGGKDFAGIKLKSVSGWKSDNTEMTDESGFTALPGGERDNHQGFGYQEYGGFWWTSTEIDADNAKSWGLLYDFNDIHHFDKSKSYGNSIRCIKDK